MPRARRARHKKGLKGGKITARPAAKLTAPEREDARETDRRVTEETDTPDINN